MPIKNESISYRINNVPLRIFLFFIDYDFDSESIVINLEKYKDKKVKAATEESVLRELIMNTYTTIL